MRSPPTRRRRRDMARLGGDDDPPGGAADAFDVASCPGGLHEHGGTRRKILGALTPPPSGRERLTARGRDHVRSALLTPEGLSLRNASQVPVDGSDLLRPPQPRVSFDLRVAVLERASSPRPPAYPPTRSSRRRACRRSDRIRLSPSCAGRRQVRLASPGQTRWR